MKKTHTIYIKHYILTLFIITFFTFSCTKQENVNDTPAIDIPNGYAAIQVEMAGIQFDEEKLGDIKKAAVRINNSQQKTATNNS